MAEAATKLPVTQAHANANTSAGFSRIDLHLDMTTPSATERKGQTVRTFRAGADVVLLEHPAGVEVRGGAWSGIVPWHSILRAIR